jgi:hypothetical protein
MSVMSRLHMSCVELIAEMEDGSIDFDQAVEMLCEEFGIGYDQATYFLTEVTEGV